MTKIRILPHPEICPNGREIEAKVGVSIAENLIAQGIDIEHACALVGACTTCHIIVREGFDSLNASDELEDDMLDKAWGLEPSSRLSCQAIVAKEELTVEIPRYSINHAKEENH